jgi:hypothetical protein
VDPQIAGHHDLQELSKTYYQVSRARTKVQHSLINHSLLSTSDVISPEVSK